jgi:hypothetical protein
MKTDDRSGQTDAYVVRHAEAGTVCDLMDRPPDQRQVSLSVLYELCVNDRWTVHPKGVRLIGALFEGTLDFERATLRVPLELDLCVVTDRLLMSWATIPGLALRDCKLSVLKLKSAAIEGELRMRGTELTGTDGGGNSLVAEGLRARDVILDSGFQAAGGVRLAGAAIEGELRMGGAQLTGTDGGGNSLVAEGLRARDVYLDSDFEAAGVVRLAGAAIEGQLSMRGPP